MKRILNIRNGTNDRSGHQRLILDIFKGISEKFIEMNMNGIICTDVSVEFKVQSDKIDANGISDTATMLAIIKSHINEPMDENAYTLFRQEFTKFYRPAFEGLAYLEWNYDTAEINKILANRFEVYRIIKLKDHEGCIKYMITRIKDIPKISKQIANKYAIVEK